MAAKGPLTDVSIYIGFPDFIWYEVKVTVRKRENDDDTFEAAMDQVHRKLRQSKVDYTFLFPSEIYD